LISHLNKGGGSAASMADRVKSAERNLWCDSCYHPCSTPVRVMQASVTFGSKFRDPCGQPLLRRLDNRNRLMTIGPQAMLAE